LFWRKKEKKKDNPARPTVVRWLQGASRGLENKWLTTCPGPYKDPPFSVSLVL